MSDIEFNNQILILLRQPKDKSARNTLDYKQLWNKITKTVSVSAT